MSSGQKPQGQTFIGAMHPPGIPDVLHTLDSRSKAVLAAEGFAACRCRVEMLKGQLLAEQDRLLELCRQVNDAMDEAIKETTNA